MPNLELLFLKAMFFHFWEESQKGKVDHFVLDAFPDYLPLKNLNIQTSCRSFPLKSFFKQQNSVLLILSAQKFTLIINNTKQEKCENCSIFVVIF